MTFFDNNGTAAKEGTQFFEANKELLKRRRKEVDDAVEAEDDLRPLNWMKCPNCGSGMQQVELWKIKLEKCTQCRGVFFDSRELQTLLESNAQDDFLNSLKILFH